MENTRNIGIDVLKSFAIFSIIAQHFFTLQTPFLTTEYYGISMFLQGCTMEFFLMGVPLFVAITGYLNIEKKASFQFYRSILKVIIPYLIISIIYIFVRIYIFDEHLTFRHSVGMILRFNAIHYGWYIEMWIGLYLLIPFLNILFNNLPNKKIALLLLATLYLLTIVPSTTNRFGFHILPDRWTAIWPVLCYYIGAYIRKFNPLVKNQYLITFILICCCIEPLLNLILFPHHDYVFVLGTGLLIYPIMAAFFMLVYRTQVNNQIIRRLLIKISNLTLNMYLFLALFDMLCYPHFMKLYESQQQFGIYFLLFVPLLFIMAFAASVILDYIIRFLRIDRIWKPKRTTAVTV